MDSAKLVLSPGKRERRAVERARRAAKKKQTHQAAERKRALVSHQRRRSRSSGLSREGAWQLLKICRGRGGALDSGRRKSASNRAVPLLLRVPSFISEPRHVFPSREITQGNPSSEISAERPIRVVDFSTYLRVPEPYGFHQPKAHLRRVKSPTKQFEGPSGLVSPLIDLPT